MTVSIAILGYGKIAADQHVPAIAATNGFHLAAIVSRRGVGPAGIPVFTSIKDLLDSGIHIDAISLCNSPAERFDAAVEAINAGLHVFLEKPPAVSLEQAETLVRLANAKGVTLFASWHARANTAVERAKEILADREVLRAQIRWCEDVNKWHPGQDWIWRAGGFGVFDPGINALSILAHILPFALMCDQARLDVPVGSETPLRVEMSLRADDGGFVAKAVFDWSPIVEECWEIIIETSDGTVMLDQGGMRLWVDGACLLTAPDEEYRRLYLQFGGVIKTATSDVDLSPLRLVAQAEAIGTTHRVDFVPVR